MEPIERQLTLEHKLSQDLLCSLIGTDKKDNEEDADVVKLLKEEKYQEILNLAIENMSHDQRVFYDKMTNKDADENIRYYFLAGLPGTGKSYLQNAIHLYLALAKKKDFICVAPTNFIAFQQHGCTIHKSLQGLCGDFKISKFRIEDDLVSKLIDRNYANKRALQNMNLEKLKEVILDYYLSLDIINSDKYNLSTYDEKLKFYESHLDDSYLKVKMILMDEGSMVSSILLALLSLQFPQSKFIIMYGPNQLPPINGFPSCDEVFFENNNTENNNVLYHALETQMRFHKECHEFTEFIAFFSNVLSGKINAQEKLSKMRHFYNKLQIGGTLNDYKYLTNDRILIVSTNKQRCRENESRLLKETGGDGKIYEFPARFDEKKLSKFYNIESSLGIDRILKIKKGVKCIVKCNDICKGLIKGMIVQVINIYTKQGTDEVVSILVKTKNNRFINVYRHSFVTLDNISIEQFPLALFYSVTAHGTQGKTIDSSVGVCLQKFYDEALTFKKGVFVALSRIKDPKQLFMDKHPVHFLEPEMAIDSLKDVDNIENEIKTNKRFKCDNDNNVGADCFSSVYDITECVKFVNKK